MTAPRYAQLAGKILAKESEAAPLGAPARSAGAMAQSRGVEPLDSDARANAIAAIERAIAAKAAQTRLRRVAIGALSVAAAAAVIAFGAAHLGARPNVAVVAAPSAAGTAPAVTPALPAVVVSSSGDGANVVGGGLVPTGAGKALDPGARVIALPHGRALLAFSTGTQVNVEEGGDVAMLQADTTQILALGSGALRADVAKLKAGERFLIRTVDAEIEVRGTSFRIATAAPNPACGDGTRTRVAVYEGVVMVRHAGAEDRVVAGHSWPQSCIEAAPQTPRGNATTRPAGVGVGIRMPAAQTPAVAPATTTTNDPPRAAPSLLAEQNDAFASAVATKRSGNARAAADGFAAFADRYPDSPLTEGALAQRMNLLGAFDRAASVSAARAYLARYPNGFARSDAEAILAEKP